MKIFDGIILAGVLAISGALAFFVYSGRAAPETVYIHAGDREWYYPLERDRDVTVPGPLGDTLVKIEEGRVFVVDSPCPARICVASGKIQDTGSWIACLPNQVFISIEGAVEKDYDAESY